MTASRYIAVEVSVTQADIERGTRYDCQRCPIALAILRLLAPPVTIKVSDTIELFEDSIEPFYCVDTPPDVVGWMNAFDEQLGALPFSFRLTLPTERVRDLSLT